VLLSRAGFAESRGAAAVLLRAVRAASEARPDLFGGEPFRPGARRSPLDAGGWEPVIGPVGVGDATTHGAALALALRALDRLLALEGPPPEAACAPAP